MSGKHNYKSVLAIIMERIVDGRRASTTFAK